MLTSTYSTRRAPLGGLKYLVAPPRESRNIIVSLESMYGTCKLQAMAEGELHVEELEEMLAVDEHAPIKEPSTSTLSERAKPPLLSTRPTRSVFTASLFNTSFNASIERLIN